MNVEIGSRPKVQPRIRSRVIESDAKSDVFSQQRYVTKQTTTPTDKAKPQSTSKHAEKVVNGIKHELDRLKPRAADTKDEKRKLRSQEGTRFKSDLSAYFPDYDEVIGNEPKETCKYNMNC